MLGAMPALELLKEDAEEITLTEEEYLATEPDRFERHEFIDGQLRAMAGASDRQYFVISQNAQRPEVTAFRRRTDFTPEILQDGPFTMESVGLALTVKELYEY